nr:hypothetical protein CFP56_22747 [Quercus suber]
MNQRCFSANFAHLFAKVVEPTPLPQLRTSTILPASSLLTSLPPLSYSPIRKPRHADLPIHHQDDSHFDTLAQTKQARELYLEWNNRC